MIDLKLNNFTYVVKPFEVYCVLWCGMEMLKLCIMNHNEGFQNLLREQQGNVATTYDLQERAYRLASHVVCQL